MSLSAETIHKMYQEYKARFPDPLEEQGIPKDHVIVVHPVIWAALQQEPGPETIGDLLVPSLYGRPIYVEAGASMEHVEFMSKEMYQFLYQNPRIIAQMALEIEAERKAIGGGAGYGAALHHL